MSKKEKTIKAKVEAQTLSDFRQALLALLEAIENGNRSGYRSEGEYWQIDYEQDLEKRIEQDEEYESFSPIEINHPQEPLP